MDRPAYPTSMKGFAPQARVEARQEEKQTSRHKKTGSLIIVACIAIALAAVLAISYYASGGLTAQAAGSTASQPQTMSAVSCGTMQEAADILGYIPAIPAQQAEGYVLVAVNVVDGKVLEMDYSNGSQDILYRTAVGSEDLSWNDTEYAFTTTEEVGGLNRTYAGAAEQKLTEAIWANEGNTYALVASGGVEADVLHLMAESVA